MGKKYMLVVVGSAGPIGLPDPRSQSYALYDSKNHDLLPGSINSRLTDLADIILERDISVLVDKKDFLKLEVPRKLRDFGLYQEDLGVWNDYISVRPLFPGEIDVYNTKKLKGLLGGLDDIENDTIDFEDEPYFGIPVKFVRNENDIVLDF